MVEGDAASPWTVRARDQTIKYRQHGGRFTVAGHLPQADTHVRFRLGSKPGLGDAPPRLRGQAAMIHAGDHEEAKVVGNTVARRLLDGGAVVERVQRCDNRIREALSPSPSRLCRRKFAARLAHAIASHIARDARPGVGCACPTGPVGKQACRRRRRCR